MSPLRRNLWLILPLIGVMAGGAFFAGILRRPLSKVEDITPVNIAWSVSELVSGTQRELQDMGMLRERAVRLTEPLYPPLARAEHKSGNVLLKLTIDEKGNVISARVVSGDPLLHAPAVVSAFRSKFQPLQIDGQPSKYTGLIAYDFQPTR